SMLQISYTNSNQREQLTHNETGPVEFGRSPGMTGARHQVLIDDFVSRDQLLIEQFNEDTVRVQNVSSKVPVTLADGTVIGPGSELLLNMPVRLTTGRTHIEIQSPSATGSHGSSNESSMRTIAAPVSLAASAAFKFDGVPDSTTLVGWFETLVNIQKATPGSDAFYEQTARAIVNLIGLDCGLVLLRKGTDWKILSGYAATPDVSLHFSRTILRNVIDEARTFVLDDDPAAAAESLTNVESAVASPVFDATGKEIIGAIYGSRQSSMMTAQTGIRDLEAQLVQVIASVVGNGLARVQSEAEAARRRVQFEQFVSPVVARELDRDPGLLDGRDREISVLFADIRNFSRLSERIGAENVCRLVQSIMNRLNACVREFSGTTVCYLGDGLMAMWNAPVDQPDHPLLACKAALAMQAQLPELNREWGEKLDTELGIGVGVNTGIAMVGNTGSDEKPHYGPLGHHVNLASRVEGATKQLGVPILVTGDVRSKLDSSIETRRICQVRVVGMNAPVSLFELQGNADDNWRQRRDIYEAALAQYEAGEWTQACQSLNPLLTTTKATFDLPSLGLMSRSIEHIKSPPAEFDPVWNLSSK
ncbi:MAG: adenylate/guanylate cyclase domain-containing protein, partial [Planctomycetota bacterium]|nr:adenylate/guanylate cyclase domain-containing protein [Planctomycetota bacterium]